MAHPWNKDYTGENLNKVAFPLGGIGAGMICLEGNGSLSHLSVRHRPEVFNQPFMFGAISVKEKNEWKARVLQGRTPDWKVMFPFGG
ncbi:MAG: GH116 family glycosyl-hydrolase, partial [Planctomycetota bacterium]